MSRLSELVPDAEPPPPTPAIEEVNAKSFPGVVKQYPIINLCTCLMEWLSAFHSFALWIFLFIVFFHQIVCTLF